MCVARSGTSGASVIASVITAPGKSQWICPPACHILIYPTGLSRCSSLSAGETHFSGRRQFIQWPWPARENNHLFKQPVCTGARHIHELRWLVSPWQIIQAAGDSIYDMAAEFTGRPSQPEDWPVSSHRRLITSRQCPTGNTQWSNKGMFADRRQEREYIVGLLRFSVKSLLDVWCTTHADHLHHRSVRGLTNL